MLDERRNSCIERLKSFGTIHSECPVRRSTAVQAYRGGTVTVYSTPPLQQILQQKLDKTVLYSLHGVRHGPAELYSQDSLYSSYTALYSIQRYTLYTLYTIQRSTTTLCARDT